MPPLSEVFARIASAVSRWTGRPVIFLACCAVVVVWAVTGPMFHFSDTWQLVINTGTTIVTFLMVFLIQNTQNRDNAALQAKLDELIRVSRAKNEYIGIEHLSYKELEHILAALEQNKPHIFARARARTRSQKAQPPGETVRAVAPAARSSA
jgi:low affinity Fe/Cu permease